MEFQGREAMSLMGVEDQIAFALRQITHALDLHSRRLLEEFGVTGPQLATLQTADRLGKASAGALAKEVQVSQATITGILDRLEHRGLINRSRDGQDRRSTFITVTEAGRHVLRSAPPPLQERFRRELTDLEEWEQTMILSTLLRIAAMMGADRLEAAPVAAGLDQAGCSTSAGESTGGAARVPAKHPTHATQKPSGESVATKPADSEESRSIDAHCGWPVDERRT